MRASSSPRSADAFLQGSLSSARKAYEAVADDVVDLWTSDASYPKAVVAAAIVGGAALTFPTVFAVLGAARVLRGALRVHEGPQVAPKKTRRLRIVSTAQ
jgi:hypothetical protein